jgi:hypothetical protein
MGASQQHVGQLGDVLKVEEGRIVGVDGHLPAGVAGRQDQDRHRLAVALGDAAEAVLRPRTVLHGEHAQPAARVEAAVGVGHVDTGALLADDDRAHVGGSGRFDDRVDGIGDERVHAFPLEDLGHGLGDFHVPSPSCPRAVRSRPSRR